MKKADAQKQAIAMWKNLPADERARKRPVAVPCGDWQAERSIDYRAELEDVEAS